MCGYFTVMRTFEVNNCDGEMMKF